MAEIKIRGLDEDIKSRLVKQAAERKLSLSKYICSILTDYALHPELKNTEDKYAVLTKNMAMLYRDLQKKTNERLSENSYALDRIADLLFDLEGKRK